MKSVKVVLVGAGSSSFGRGTLADLMACQELWSSREVTVGLVDIDGTALETMRRFAEILKGHRGADVTIEASTERADVLPGADYVVTAVSRRRNELWSQDFHIPLAYGFLHPLGECGGPGAAFHTLRSLHLVIRICRDMERLCPDALLLNFTNPESRVCLGVTRLTGIKAVGLCHGPISTHQVVADLLDRKPEDIEISVGGINHFHWVVNVTEAGTGMNLMEQLNEAVPGAGDRLDALTTFCHRTYGLLPFPSPSHTAEYLGYGYEFIGPYYLRYSAAVEAAEFGNTPTTGDRIARVAAGEDPLTDDLAAPTSEFAVRIIHDIEQDAGSRLISSNVPNTGNAVTNLPEDAIVEVPIRVDAAGVHAEPVGALPDAVAALCRMQISIQELLVQAYAEGSMDLLLQALLLEPTVDSTRRAREMMDEMLRLQAAYLPELA